MPPLVIPSPAILDQTFPRSVEELKIVAASLGRLAEITDEAQCGVLLTNALRDFVELFDWDRAGPYPLLLDVHRMLAQLFLQPHELLFQADTQDVDEQQRHPLPGSCVDQGLALDWSVEVGKMLCLHKMHCPGSAFSVGVACALAFAGERKDTYQFSVGDAVEQEAFPIVGPEDVAGLDDVYDWDVPGDIHQKSVSFDAAKKNCFVIGATEVLRPANSSHYVVKFRNQRSWPLDYNTDPIPDRFLGQLKVITGYPLLVVKTALIEGRLPEKKIKIPQLYAVFEGLAQP